MLNIFRVHSVHPSRRTRDLVSIRPICRIGLIPPILPIAPIRRIRPIPTLCPLRSFAADLWLQLAGWSLPLPFEISNLKYEILFPSPATSH